MKEGWKRGGLGLCPSRAPTCLFSVFSVPSNKCVFKALITPLTEAVEPSPEATIASPSRPSNGSNASHLYIPVSGKLPRVCQSYSAQGSEFLRTAALHTYIGWQHLPTDTHSIYTFTSAPGPGLKKKYKFMSFENWS